VNTFVSDSRKRASNEQSSPSTTVSSGKFKKSRLSNDNVKKEMPTSHHQHQQVAGPPSTVKSPPLMLSSNVSLPPLTNSHQPLATNQSISSQNQSQFNANNLYNAYTMARMFPFMYQQNPLQQQQQQQPQSTSPQASSFFGILNQNLLSQYNTMQQQQQQQQQHQSRSLYSAYNVHHEQQQQQQQNIFSTLFSNQQHHHNHQNNNSTTSDDHPTNSCSNSSSSSANLSYSTSSRSSSLSPGAVSIVKERVKEEPSIKNLPLPKKSFNIDQMLSTTPTTTTSSSTAASSTVTKTTRDMDTQTDATCLNCPMCSSKCV